MMDDASDGYLFWRITEGGATDLFKSAMPAWGDALSEEEIWKVIAFIRSFDE
jgi:mono/diheme cytochrome c family protein